MGVEKLKSVVVNIAVILNAVSAFIHKQGLLALYPILGAAQSLAAVDWKGVLVELLDMDLSESDQVEGAFNGALKLQNPNVQVKLSEAINCAQDVAAIVKEGVSLFGKGKAVVMRVKQLVAPQAA